MMSRSGHHPPSPGRSAEPGVGACSRGGRGCRAMAEASEIPRCRPSPATASLPGGSAWLPAATPPRHRGGGAACGGRPPCPAPRAELPGRGAAGLWWETCPSPSLGPVLPPPTALRSVGWLSCRHLDLVPDPRGTLRKSAAGGAGGAEFSPALLESGLWSPRGADEASPCHAPGTPGSPPAPGHAAWSPGCGGVGGLSLPRPLSPPRGPDIFKRRIFPTRLSSCQECASRNAQGPSKNNFQT